MRLRERPEGENRKKKKKKVNTAAQQRHNGAQEAETITLEGYWSISHSAAAISPAAAVGRLL